MRSTLVADEGGRAAAFGSLCEHNSQHGLSPWDYTAACRIIGEPYHACRERTLGAERADEQPFR